MSVAAALGGLLFGFDTAVISGAIPYIKNYFSLNEFMLGWAVSSILIGCGAGAVLAGPLADRYGRKWVLLCCAVLFALSGVGAALSGTLLQFVFFRLLGGLGVGAAAMVSPMYIAEISPSFLRGRLVAMYQLAIVTGILLAYFSNYLLAGAGANNWRWMFASQTAPSLLFLLVLLRIPETPRWLIKKDRTEQARIILQKTEYGGDHEKEIAAIRQSFSNDSAPRLSEM
ncbi:MAG TPA: MFS transporter, partial [Puia sp.]